MCRPMSHVVPYALRGLPWCIPFLAVVFRAGNNKDATVGIQVQCFFNRVAPDHCLTTPPSMAPRGKAKATAVKRPAAADAADPPDPPEKKTPAVVDWMSWGADGADLEEIPNSQDLSNTGIEGDDGEPGKKIPDSESASGEYSADEEKEVPATPQGGDEF